MEKLLKMIFPEQPISQRHWFHGTLYTKNGQTLLSPTKDGLGNMDTMCISFNKDTIYSKEHVGIINY